MEKEILEIQRQHLANVVTECDPKMLVEAQKEFALSYTYDAVGMKGPNRISYQDVKRLSQAKAILGYSEREQKEILNHLEAFEFVKKEAHNKNVFNEDSLKDIHEMLVENIFQGGVYRNVNISIFGAAHQPPDYVKVYDRMNRFFINLEQFKGDALQKATYAHASIAKIHPFVDANGRLAKLVLNYFLIKGGYLPISIPLQDREKYFMHLESFKSDKDLKPITKFFKALLISRYEALLNQLDI